MSEDAFARLAQKLHSRFGNRPGSYRGLVTQADPMVIDVFGVDDLTLDEEDEDVDVTQAVKDLGVEEGDVVLIHRDDAGDWIVSGISARG